MNALDRIDKRFPDWNYDHPRILYALIRSLKPDVCVEVGTYRGYAACYMAQALKENGKGKLVCIDNWIMDDHVGKYGDPKQHFWENTKHCEVQEYVEIIEGNSFEVEWPENIDFAYIDGWHSRCWVTEDFKRAASNGAKTICFDDVIGHIGPRILMDELAGEHWSVGIIDSNGGLGIVTRKDKFRKIEFSQEEDYPCPGTDLYSMTEGELQDYYLEHGIPSEYIKITAHK